ncbi:MAG: hypothetical protein LIP09_06555 [Bacteroidales bacterium]|nr:hypothetical protein [Bacteroidales bacterium]
MKVLRFLTLLSAAALVVAATSCSNDDEPEASNKADNENKIEKEYEENGDLTRCDLDDFRAATYTFDDEGYCNEATSCGMTATDFHNKVVGHLWKEDNSWEILDDGKPDPLSIWEEGICGYGTQSYNFIDDASFKILFYADAYPADCFWLREYTYNAEHRAVECESSSPIYIGLEFHPLSVSEVDGVTYMYTVRFAGIRGGGSSGYQNVYWLTSFKMIPDEDIESYEAKFPTDFTTL